MNPVLKENNPELAEYIAQLSGQFERGYELAGNDAERACLIEGIKEFGKLVASGSKSASLSVDVGDSGLTRITITANPG